MAITGEQTQGGGQGLDERPRLNRVPVSANGRMRPHRRVHGRHRQNRRLCGKQQAGDEAIGEPSAPAPKTCCAQRRNDDEISPLGQFDVQWAWTCGRPFITVLITAMTTQTGQSHRTHQARCTGRHHTSHLGSSLHEGTDEERRLDRRNASATGNKETPSS